jgi:hypothetical protein
MQRPRVVCRRLAVSYTRRLQAKTREASRSCDGAPIEERWAVALASRRPTEARYISRACDPTAGLLNRGTKSSLDWEGGDTVHLGPCQAHRGEATASRGFCSRARGGVFAEVELTPALDETPFGLRHRRGPGRASRRRAACRTRRSATDSVRPGAQLVRRGHSARADRRACADLSRARCTGSGCRRAACPQAVRRALWDPMDTASRCESERIGGAPYRGEAGVSTARAPGCRSGRGGSTEARRPRDRCIAPSKRSSPEPQPARSSVVHFDSRLEQVTTPASPSEQKPREKQKPWVTKERRPRALLTGESSRVDAGAVQAAGWARCRL